VRRRLPAVPLAITAVTVLLAAPATAGTVLLAAPATAALDTAAPGPPSAPEWWFDSWQVPALWAAGADGRGITVAVIDSGVQADIPELRGKVLPGADFIGNGSDGRTDYDNDEFSHGTAMASLIVAAPGFAGIEGLAPAAKILPVAVPLVNVVRRGEPPPNSTANAIEYAADHGARIISMSLGGPRYEGRDQAPCPQTTRSARARWWWPPRGTPPTRAARWRSPASASAWSRSARWMPGCRSPGSHRAIATSA